jgi:hypothetical protein
VVAPAESYADEKTNRTRLEQSRKFLGLELQEMLVDSDGTMLSGHVRKAAGFKLTRKIDTSKLAKKWERVESSFKR